MPEAFKTHFRRERFAREYLLDLNGTRAAIRSGYSAKTAPQAASRMLKNVKVRALLKELLRRFIGPR
jgi:phage terminase small subunit